MNKKVQTKIEIRERPILRRIFGEERTQETLESQINK